MLAHAHIYYHCGFLSLQTNTFQPRRSSSLPLAHWHDHSLFTSTTPAQRRSHTPFFASASFPSNYLHILMQSPPSLRPSSDPKPNYSVTVFALSCPQNFTHSLSKFTEPFCALIAEMVSDCHPAASLRVFPPLPARSHMYQKSDYTRCLVNAMLPLPSVAPVLRTSELRSRHVDASFSSSAYALTRIGTQSS